jgi:hypothetical protein
VADEGFRSGSRFVRADLTLRLQDHRTLFAAQPALMCLSQPSDLSILLSGASRRSTLYIPDLPKPTHSDHITSPTTC